MKPTRYAQALAIEIRDLDTTERTIRDQATTAERFAAMSLRERADELRRRKEVLEARLARYRQTGRIGG